MSSLKRTFIRFIQILINLTVEALLKIKVQGKKNIPRVPSALIVANHCSYLDVPVIGHTFFHNLMNISWVISKENFNFWFLKWLFLIFKVIRINGTIDKVIKDLDDRRWVVIFPEGGERWCPPKKEKKHKAKKGAAVIALTTGVTMIPVKISGADKVLPPRSFRYQGRHTIKVSIGKPFSYPKVNKAKIDKETAQKITQEIFEKIQSV
ncbi:MAG: 1-acyl-sn-glycerol-3-phosphate acyltransferase [Candidatus Omnitrophica bacterium]|nr:1-acyl-sn-glycerol-3-phosphate acyltransferase [Candidatus Omnitrophota bacterium]